jgi:hypothetical protein
MKKLQNNFCHALDSIDGSQKPRKGKAVKDKQSKHLFSDVWVNATVTSSFVLAKISGYPQWPARICVAKDPAIESTLKNAGLCIISFVGEPHQHVVKRDEDIQPFTAENIDAVDLSKTNADLVKKFKQVGPITQMKNNQPET